DGSMGGVGASFSADGRRLAGASAEGAARVWDSTTGRPVTGWLRHPGWITHAELSPDGRLLVTTGQDRTARGWEGATGRCRARLKHRHAVRFATFSPDNRRVVTATGDFSTFHELIVPMSDAGKKGEARVWEADTGRPVTPPIPHEGV